MTEASAPAAAEFETRDVVFMGQRMLADGKIGHVFITAEKLAELVQGDAHSSTIEAIGSAFTPAKTRDLPRTIGGIYALECAIGADGTINRARAAGARFKAMCQLGPVGEWVAADRAVKMRKQAKLEEAKAAGDNELDRALDVLARHYQRSAARNRSAFMVMVFDRLQKRDRQ